MCYSPFEFGLPQGRAAWPLSAASGRAAVVGTSTITLSAEARAALLFQIEEERMAGQLYRA